MRGLATTDVHNGRRPDVLPTVGPTARRFPAHHLETNLIVVFVTLRLPEMSVIVPQLASACKSQNMELLAKLPARPVFCLLEADFVVEGLGFGATSWYVVFLQ